MVDPKKSGVWFFGGNNQEEDSEIEYYGGTAGITGNRAEVLSEMNFDDVQENIMLPPDIINIPQYSFATSDFEGNSGYTIK